MTDDTNIADILSGKTKGGYLRATVETITEKDAKDYHIVELGIIDLSGASTLTLFNPTIQPMTGRAICVAGGFTVKEFRGKKSINPAKNAKIWIPKDDGTDPVPQARPAASLPAASTIPSASTATLETIAAQFTVTAKEVIDVIDKRVAPVHETLVSILEQLKDVDKHLVTLLDNIPALLKGDEE